MFIKKDSAQPKTADRLDRLVDFSYLDNKNIYLDSACQSLRPLPVIGAINDYYQNYNACGGRVKYQWGQKVDKTIDETRELVLSHLDLSAKKYTCSFTLNTTYGINLILSQIPMGKYDRVVTSEIEHNSVFLSTIELAKRLGVDRLVLDRDDTGNLLYNSGDLHRSIVVVNSTSNIDGRQLSNIKELIRGTHKNGGIVILDAAQTMAHYHSLIKGCGADAICFSAHKMYSASLGVIIINNKLLDSLDKRFVGGGMVSTVDEQTYTLLADDRNSWLEPGLQAYGEIIALNQAIKWRQSFSVNGLSVTAFLDQKSSALYQGLSQIPNVVMINDRPSSVISFYSKKTDAHRLATFLSASGIMARSGYFCCHYYLLNKRKLPPLIRLSIGLHTTDEDIEKTNNILARIA